MTRKALNDTVVRAPISGKVLQRLTQAGERLPVDGRALEIVDLRQLELEASVGAAESLQLRIGQQARLRLEGSEQFIDARLVSINPSAQTSSRSVLAYLSIDTKQSRETLRQSLFAQGTLGTGQREVVTVPVTAVRIDKPLAYVQVLEQDQVRHQGVNLGERGIIDGEERMVVNLEPGAKVLRGSVGALSDGLPVRLTNLTPSITAKPAP